MRQTRPGSSDCRAFSWIGDFDHKLKRRLVRISVPFSRTSFFLDKGVALGFEAELGQAFENWLNKRYGKKPYRIHVTFISTSASNLTVTAERESIVEFAAPWATGIKEVLVPRPTAPEIHSIDDLGEQVLMALAAYNTGPGTLRKFRDHATKHGLVPNRWFENVGAGASEIVGQETVGDIGTSTNTMWSIQPARKRKRVNGAP
jgi:hypothetical protein